MDRRIFLKKIIGTTIVAGSTVAFGDYARLFAAPDAFPPAYDLVADRGGESEVMFDKAIASFGGIQEFVPRGSKVLVKPNIGWDVTPDRAGNTHPKLVARIVEQCLSAGAKQVSVFDHTCDPWAQCYRNSGIERAAFMSMLSSCAPGVAIMTIDSRTISQCWPFSAWCDSTGYAP